MPFPRIGPSVFTALLLLNLGVLHDALAQDYKNVETAFPGLAAGILKTAYLSKLPPGTLLTVDKVTIKETELAQTISKAPAPLQAQLKKNGVFLLENLASNSLLLKEAQVAGYKKTKDETQMIRDFLGEKVKNIQVSEEGLLRSYEENKSSFGGAPLEEVRGMLKEVLLQQERKKAMEAYIQTLSRRSSIYVDESWIKKQALLARDNPVDKLRMSGKPSLVDFGSTGCGPCDLMTPILDRLKKKYQGKLNVYFVHVQEEKFLATRFGIRFIPVQVFFDKTGTEVFPPFRFFPGGGDRKKISPTTTALGGEKMPMPYLKTILIGLALAVSRIRANPCDLGRRPPGAGQRNGNPGGLGGQRLHPLQDDGAHIGKIGKSLSGQSGHRFHRCLEKSG